jgi:DNA modification methylase
VSVRILLGDVRARLRDLEADSVNCVVTSPPYWGLRSYHVDGQLGLEATAQEHVDTMVDVFREVRRVLRPDGVCWVNYGDSYATGVNGRSAADTKAAGNDDRTFRDKPFSTAVGGLKSKDLCMVPFRFAIAMQADGWWLRSVLPWVKRNGMPESISDRPATAVEYVFMFTKSARYWYDAEAVRKAASANTHARVSQNVAAQVGSSRANGNTRTDRPMKAVVRTPKSAPPGSGIRANHSFQAASSSEVLLDRNFRNTDLFFDSLDDEQPPAPVASAPAKPDKQRGHGRRHQGFNERWDQMERAEQQANGRNFRNTDLMFESIDGAHGLISDAEGNPLALDVAPHPFTGAHFATFPPKLIEPLIKAGCPQGGTVLDPFGGAGTTGLVADRLKRNAVLIELNEEYAKIAENRLHSDGGMFLDFAIESNQTTKYG